MMYVQSCFHIHLLKVESFSALTFNVSLSIYKHDFVTLQLAFEAIVIQNAIYTSVMWKPEASSAHMTVDV